MIRSASFSPAHTLSAVFFFRKNVFLLVITLGFGELYSQENEAWNRFRGPNGSGVLSEFNGPLPWDDSHILHRIDLPGTGNGSPIIFNNTVYLQAADVNKKVRSLIAIDLASGEVKWQSDTSFSPYSIHKFSSYASSTPCVDKDRIYNAWGAPDALTIAAFSHQGDCVWNRDLGSHVSQHGFANSPVRVGNFVVLFNSQDALDLPPGIKPGNDKMIAIQSQTGEIAWECELMPTRVCYGVPIVDSDDGKLIICNASSAEGFFAIDAISGNKIFSALPFNKRICSSCSINDEIIVASEGSGGGGNIIVAYDRKTHKERFRIEKSASYVPTTLLHNNKLFVWSDNGIVSCIDTNGGKVLATQRVGGNFSASPVLLRNRLLNISHEGVVTILSADEKLIRVGSVALEQTSRATIAATSDKLLLRTDEQLWIIGYSSKP